MSKLGLADVPANLLIDEKGVVIERNIPQDKLEEIVNKEMLKRKVDALLK